MIIFWNQRCFFAGNLTSELISYIYFLKHWSPINKILVYFDFVVLIFKRLLGSIDNIVPIDTSPSLPSFMILKKQLRLSEFNKPGQISITPIEIPVNKYKQEIRGFIIDFFLRIIIFYSLKF